MIGKTGVNQGGGVWTEPRGVEAIHPNLATPTGHHRPPGRRPIKKVPCVKPRTKKIKF